MDEYDYFAKKYKEDIRLKEAQDEFLKDEEITIKDASFMGYDEEISGSLENKTCKFCRKELDIEDNICPSCGSTISSGIEEGA